MKICMHILQTTLRFPPNPAATAEAVSFIRSLLCDVSERLTYPEIRAHPFMACVDWDMVDSGSVPVDIPTVLPERTEPAVAPPRQPLRVMTTGQQSRARTPPPPPRRVFT